METDKEKLERFIANEYAIIENLKKQKKEIDVYIDNCIGNIARYRLRLIQIDGK